MESRSGQLAADFLRGKRVVVLGAGYLGAAVLERARHAGAATFALTRNEAQVRRLAGEGATVVQADLATVDWHASLPPEADHVLVSVGAGGGGLEGYRRSYVDGLHSALAWGRNAVAPGRLVYTSSTAVYPQGGGVTVDETAPLDGADERGRILREAEELALGWPGGGVVLRLAGIYGPSRHHLLDTLRSGASALPGRADHRLNLIHRDDAAAAVIAAWGGPAAAAGEVFNVADDGATPKGEVAAWLAAQLGRPAPGFTGEPLGTRRPNPPDRIVSNARLKTVLGWRPVYPTFRQGYAALLQAPVRGTAAQNPA